MSILAKASASPTKGLHLALGLSAESPQLPPPCGACQMSVGLTTLFKKKHSSNLPASRTGTWTLPVQHLQGKSWCHPTPRLQPGSLLLPQELGKPSKRRCGASGASARAVADNSVGGYALSRPGGCDPAQEEQEQSLAKGTAAAALQTWGQGGLAGSSSVPKIRGSFCPESHLHKQPHTQLRVGFCSASAVGLWAPRGISKGQGSICTQRGAVEGGVLAQLSHLLCFQCSAPASLPRREGRLH